MDWTNVSLMDLDRRRGGRNPWADIAKALSIILLVIWTTVGDAYYVNDLLILARMPLFFFVSGFFAWRIVVDADLGAFLRDRVGNLVYLYALWTWLLYLTTRGAANVFFGVPTNPKSNLWIFTDPPLTIWFLYALAFAFVIARAARGLPIWMVMAGSFACYAAAVWTGDWRHMGFLERVVRLFPFFWLGLIARPVAAELVERAWRWWPALGAGFFAAAWATLDTPLAAFAPATFAVTLLGILWLLTLARRLADSPLAPPLAVLGTATLYVYVLQRIQLFYLEKAREALDLSNPAWGFLEAAIIVVVGVLVGRWAAARPGLGWLFQAPWVGAGQAARRANV